MRLQTHQLANHVKQTLSPLYLISGDVPLLVQETNDVLRHAAIAQGYTDRQVLTDWSQLHDNTHHLSLFSTKQLFEIRLNSSKLGDAGNKILEAYATQPPQDVILIITLPKIETATQSTRWFKAVDRIGIIMQIWPVEIAQMPRWVAQRLTEAGLQATPESIALLADSCAGNLLAAAQAIEKLRLVCPTKKIEAHDISNIMSDHGQFDIFQWVDTVLQGQKPAQVIRMLNMLRASGVEPVLILWALLRDIRLLTHMTYQITQGKSASQVLQTAGIWEKRKPIFTRLLQQHKLSHWYQQLQQAMQIDRMIKGIEPGNVWDALQHIGLHSS